MSGSRRGNGMRYGRSVVIWGSLVLTIVALVVYVVMVVAHQANPVWNRALLTYCGVFWGFFAFDEFGRRSAILAEERRAAAPASRPRPQPNSSMPLPTADSVRTAPRFTASGEVDPQEVLPEVGLQRIQHEMLPTVQAMVNDCLTEVLALSGNTPQASPSGRVAGFDVEAWLSDERIFPFVITSGDKTAGVAALRRDESSYELMLFYVKQGLRRQHIGQRAFARLEEFSRLLGVRQAMTAHVSSVNMRGQRFYRSVGMTILQHRNHDAVAVTSPDEMESATSADQVESTRSPDKIELVTSPRHQIELRKDILHD